MNYYLLLGGNLGDVDATMSEALRRLDEGGHVVAVSRTVVSPPWGFESSSPFHNLVVRYVTDVGPFALLSYLKHLEVELGRKPKSNPNVYENRPIDIDILFCGDEVVNTEVLQIPHPRLHLRRFTLMPLADIAPDFVHPTLRRTVTELLADCPDDSVVTFLD